MSASEADARDALLRQLMAVTAVDQATASGLLAAAGDNLQRAVDLFFESPSVSTTTTATAQCADVVAPAVGGEQDDVRAPIRPRADVLLGAEDAAVNYARGDSASSRRRRRTCGVWRAPAVLDRFRDFSAEIRLQERGSTSGGANENESAGSQAAKRRTLEEIFRPPLQLLCAGSFETARSCGVQQRRWLLVNVQNTAEFACQVLNRDVWSQAAVASLVRRSFVLWQVYDGSEAGRRYCTFYPVSRWPYVAVLDPRTGQLMHVWHQLDSDNAVHQLTDFLAQHHFDHDDAPVAEPTESSEQRRVVDLREEEQMRLAIERSMRSERRHSSGSSCSEADDTGDDNDVARSGEVTSESPSCTPTSPTTSASVAVSQEEQWRRYRGADSDPQWTLALRLPDSRRVPLQLPCSSLVRCVTLYAEQLGFDTASHELVATFPRRKLSSADTLDLTLQQAGLRAHDTLFVQPL